MANQIEVDSIEIDLDDPASALKALRRIEFKIGSGEGVVRAKIDGDDVTYNGGNLSWVQGKIKQLEATIARSNGRRSRHAASVRYI